MGEISIKRILAAVAASVGVGAVVVAPAAAVVVAPVSVVVGGFEKRLSSRLLLLRHLGQVVCKTLVVVTCSHGFESHFLSCYVGLIYAVAEHSRK